jgi:hypothetical protein
MFRVQVRFTKVTIAWRRKMRFALHILKEFLIFCNHVVTMVRSFN